MVNFLKEEKTQSREENRILSVKAIVQEDGKKANVSCELVNQRDYEYYFIFDITEEEFLDGIRLGDLMLAERKPHIERIASPKDYIVTISRKGTRCLAFLGRYDAEKHCYFLLDQEEGNVSALLKIQPVIHCEIRYSSLRSGILRLKPSSRWKAVVTLSGDRPMQETSLIYRLEGGGRESVLYGIDLPLFWERELVIQLKKTERVRFLPPADQSYRLQA